MKTFFLTRRAMKKNVFVKPRTETRQVWLLPRRELSGAKSWTPLNGHSRVSMPSVVVNAPLNGHSLNGHSVHKNVGCKTNGYLPESCQQEQGWRTSPACRFFLVALFLFPLFSSCRRNAPEEILLPYAKKKYSPELWHPAVVGQRGNDTLTIPEPIMAGPLPCPAMTCMFDSVKNIRPEWEFLAHFLWLQTPSFTEDREYWTVKQHQAFHQYLNALSYRRNGGPSPFLVWKNQRITADQALFHDTLSVLALSHRDTIPLHLFYRENAFKNGQNPTVLLPYSPEMGRYLNPPDCFFESGGVLAVLGEPKHVVLRDSSRFLAKSDSLYRRIWFDTAQSWTATQRRIYLNFRSDSVSIAALITVTEKEVAPYFHTDYLIAAANRLIADMYTTPAKMALLAVGEENALAEPAIYQRGDLFRAAVFDLSQDSGAAAFWQQVSADPIRSGKRPAVLTIDGSGHRKILAAFFQDKDSRKTGENPFLLADTLGQEDAWKFILYRIAREEQLVLPR